MAKRQRVVNVVPNVAGHGVKEALEEEALARGMKIRPFIGLIYEYAVDHQDTFNIKLKAPKPKNGSHIGAVTTSETADKLNAWAKTRSSSRGLLCNHILEVALELGIVDDIIDT